MPHEFRPGDRVKRVAVVFHGGGSPDIGAVGTVVGRSPITNSVRVRFDNPTDEGDYWWACKESTLRYIGMRVNPATVPQQPPPPWGPQWGAGHAARV